MTNESCTRLWEVEACYDGRLNGESLLDAERHRAHCGECAAEADRLARLGNALRALAPGAHDEVAHVRLRRRVLSAANARMHAVPSRLRLVAASLAIAATLSVGLALWSHGGRPLRVERAPCTVAAKAETRWSSHVDAGVQRIHLVYGTLALQITRIAGDPLVVVDVPDGEIEDQGTRFSVSVRDGVTTEVRVLEGAVTFRRRGNSAVTLREGARWSRAAESAEEPSTSRAPRVDDAPRVMPLAAVSASSATSSGRGTGVAPRPSSTPSSGAPAGAAATPSDEGNTEDLAYLRVLALVREGRRDEARLAAREYLQKYPNGLRRVEVAEVAK